MVSGCSMVRARGVVSGGGAHLQPYVAEPATPRGGACNPKWWILQPYVMRGAGGCGAPHHSAMG